MIGQSHRLHLTLLLSTPLGRWSVVLAAVSLVSLRLFFALVDAGQVGGEGFFDNWLLTGPLLIVLFAAVAGLIAAILAIARSGERGLLLVLPILWGLVVASFALGEFTNPH